MTLTFDLTHDLDLGCFKVKFRNSSISGIVGLIDVKWKGSELIWYWADCMTLPFDHIHDLDFGVSRSDFEIALSQEWGGLLTISSCKIDTDIFWKVGSATCFGHSLIRFQLWDSHVKCYCNHIYIYTCIFKVSTIYQYWSIPDYSGSFSKKTRNFLFHIVNNMSCDDVWIDSI